MQQIVSPHQVRDLAVQIFDSYCVTHTDLLIDGEIAEVVGACCILLSSKMEGELTTQSSFPHINPHYMEICEAHVLKMINFCIVPNATPSAFVEELLEMPHPSEQSESVAQVANDYIGSFLDGAFICEMCFLFPDVARCDRPKIPSLRPINNRNIRSDFGVPQTW